MSTSRIDRNITIGQARRAPPGSPEREAFDKALAPALEAVRRLGARMRPAARLIAARAAMRPARPKPKASKPRAARRPRRPSRPAAARKASTGDPDPASRPPGDPLGRTENQHRHDLEQRASCASGERMSMAWNWESDPWIARMFDHLARLGGRAVFEATREMLSGADPRRVLAAYARLSPDMLRAAGGDRWPPSLSPMPGGRAAS